MTDRTPLHGLQVATILKNFIDQQVLPGSGVDAADFWAGFDKIVADLAPKNAALLAERERLQTELDAWHRANPGPQDPKAHAGYVTEAYVVEQAEKAGFRLQAKAQVNANLKDTKDHPFGVWTLPPTRLTAPFGKPADAAFDRTKYDAIGESDRMTLRFAKPN